MVDTWIIPVIAGTLLGVLAGLGTGGGSLLILWLSMVAGFEAADARAINLMFYIPSAVISSIFRWKQGDFSIRKVAPAIITGCICAAVFSFISSRIDVQLLKKLFGGLLILIGTKELFYRPRKDK